MQNFSQIGDKAIQLPSGVFAGVESFAVSLGGELEGIRLSEKNMLLTHIGELIPAYTENYRRKNKHSVEFYKTGMPKAVYLEEQTEIITPIGEFPAELAIFYETGELKRFFPLDGKISGLWTEAEERQLAIPFSFELPFAKFTALISSVSFYKDGSIRAITLFPGESVQIETSYGAIGARHGFSLYETGELESLEPSEPVEIDTPIGLVWAYDPNAVGITAEKNSLCFDKEGRALSLSTAHCQVCAQTKEERLLVFSPKEKTNPLDDESLIVEGLKIAFDYIKGSALFSEAGASAELALNECAFSIIPYRTPALACNPSDCASCLGKCSEGAL